MQLYLRGISLCWLSCRVCKSCPGREPHWLCLHLPCRNFSAPTILMGCWVGLGSRMPWDGLQMSCTSCIACTRCSSDPQVFETDLRAPSKCGSDSDQVIGSLSLLLRQGKGTPACCCCAITVASTAPTSASSSQCTQPCGLRFAQVMCMCRGMGVQALTDAAFHYGTDPTDYEKYVQTMVSVLCTYELKMPDYHITDHV